MCGKEGDERNRAESPVGMWGSFGCRWLQTAEFLSTFVLPQTWQDWGPSRLLRSFPCLLWVPHLCLMLQHHPHASRSARTLCSFPVPCQTKLQPCSDLTAVFCRPAIHLIPLRSDDLVAADNSLEAGRRAVWDGWGCGRYTDDSNEYGKEDRG